MKYYVYTLIDPRTDQIFYVGKGCGARMYRHVSDVRNGKIANHSNLKLSNKIKKILSLKLRVNYNKVFITLNENEAYNKEKELIKEIGLDNLCNLKDGGGTGYAHSIETKNKMRKNAKHRFGEKNPFYGKSHTHESKKRIAEQQKQRFSDIKNREQLSGILKQKYSTMNDEERKNRFGNNRGQKTWNYGISGYKLNSKSKKIANNHLNKIIELRQQNMSYEKIAKIISEIEDSTIGWWLIRRIISLTNI